MGALGVNTTPWLLSHGPLSAGSRATGAGGGTPAAGAWTRGLGTERRVVARVASMAGPLPARGFGTTRRVVACRAEMADARAGVLEGVASAATNAATKHAPESAHSASRLPSMPLHWRHILWGLWRPCVGTGPAPVPAASAHTGTCHWWGGGGRARCARARLAALGPGSLRSRPARCARTWCAHTWRAARAFGSLRSHSARCTRTRLPALPRRTHTHTRAPGAATPRCHRRRGARRTHALPAPPRRTPPCPHPAPLSPEAPPTRLGHLLKRPPLLKRPRHNSDPSASSCRPTTPTQAHSSQRPSPERSERANPCRRSHRGQSAASGPTHAAAATVSRAQRAGLPQPTQPHVRGV